MAFMRPEYVRATPRAPWVRVEDKHGDTHAFPADVYDPLPGDTVEPVTSGWFYRLSAPGYLDATDWSGPCPDLEAARDELSSLYDCDPDDGDEISEED